MKNCAACKTDKDDSEFFNDKVTHCKACFKHPEKKHPTNGKKKNKLRPAIKNPVKPK